MSWDVRPCGDTTEQRDAMSAIWHYFGRAAPRDDQVASLAQSCRPSACTRPGRRAHRGRRRRLSVSGSRCRGAASCGWCERGRGAADASPARVLTAMMRAQLDDCRARGEPVAFLWASEDRIYAASATPRLA